MPPVSRDYKALAARSVTCHCRRLMPTGGKGLDKAMRTLRETLGANVLSARTKRGWSRETLASAMETSRAYIGRIELGQVNVGIDTVCRLAIALKKNPDDLLKRGCAAPD